MKTKLLARAGYTHTSVESVLRSGAGELTDYAKIQGAHDGQKKTGIATTHFKIKLLDVVRANVQQTIYTIIKALQVAPAVVQAREAETAGQQQIDVNTVAIKEKKLTIASLERSKTAGFPGGGAVHIGKLISLLACIVGAVDAAVAYSNFRLASYPKPLATMAALAVFFFVAVAHLFLTPFVKHAKTHVARVVRVVAVLAGGLLLFYSIAQVRTIGVNGEIILPEYGIGTQIQPPPASPWPICLISYGLFVGVFCASLFFWRNTDERNIQEKETANRRKLYMLRKEVNTLEEQNKKIADEIQKQKDQVREIFSYCKAAILQAKNTGVLAIAQYKQVYADYADSIPAFFSDTHTLVYDEELNFFKPENKEQ